MSTAHAHVLPILQPIAVVAIQHPEYDNRLIRNFGAWLVVNADALDRYWLSLTQSTGRPDPDYFRWLAIQHDIAILRSTP